MKYELVCNGSPTHVCFNTKEEADTERDKRPETFQPEGRPFEVPQEWTVREVDDDYAARFMPKV